MRIGIDISSITPLRTGIGQYTYELVRRLVKYDQHEFVLLFNSLRQPLPVMAELDRPNVEIRRTRIPGPLLLKLWQYTNRPCIDALAGKVDLFHSPGTYVPPQRSGLSITTVHDLYFEDHPADTSWIGGKHLRWILRNRVPSLSGVIAVSSLTANSLRESLAKKTGSRKPELAVIAHGIDDHFFAPRDASAQHAVRGQFGIPDRYILHVGTHEPRKNLQALIEAYRIAREKCTRIVPPLVLAGTCSGKIRLEDGIIMPGYIPAQLLPALYRGADLFVYPSLLEGFGLPVLEAMASQVPVICSEHVGALEFLPPDSVITVPPDSSEAISKAICRVYAMPPEARANLVATAQEAAGRMTWDLCAKLTMAFYESLNAVQRST